MATKPEAVNEGNGGATTPPTPIQPLCFREGEKLCPCRKCEGLAVNRETGKELTHGER